MLGLTATLRREDGLERGIRMLIGPVAARVKPSSAYPIYLDVLRSEPLTGVKTEAASHAELLNLLAADAERNRWLLERIRELARAAGFSFSRRAGTIRCSSPARSKARRPISSCSPRASGTASARR